MSVVINEHAHFIGLDNFGSEAISLKPPLDAASKVMRVERSYWGHKKAWDALLNSLKCAYSNGPVGAVNRLNGIKRQMYGRTKFGSLCLKDLYKT
ncbi:transposase [Deinococcus cellulosilyticus]|uniref:Transposase n=1 Tax=Deinococcus cellulosilyticus (strain DSM 18568 / NBRC 106333 / KACC 11606 / 5516J-15) TaxID=1223518 RepID=A0A511N8L0_DEIC1|nr:transposase [Deinococcus cellulosilyticus]GEM49132.1 hypothetical protein DC3_47670 [Deinococcus cellulosilyticus NBRC 106333 = KACC 11606]